MPFAINSQILAIHQRLGGHCFYIRRPRNNYYIYISRKPFVVLQSLSCIIWNALFSIQFEPLHNDSIGSKWHFYYSMWECKWTPSAVSYLNLNKNGQVIFRVSRSGHDRIVLFVASETRMKKKKSFDRPASGIYTEKYIWNAFILCFRTAIANALASATNTIIFKL